MVTFSTGFSSSKKVPLLRRFKVFAPLLVKVTLTSELPEAASLTLKGVSLLLTSTEAAVAYDARAAIVSWLKTFIVNRRWWITSKDRDRLL
jgi:hypothetical protein